MDSNFKLYSRYYLYYFISKEYFDNNHFLLPKNRNYQLRIYNRLFSFYTYIFSIISAYLVVTMFLFTFIVGPASISSIHPQNSTLSILPNSPVATEKSTGSIDHFWIL